MTYPENWPEIARQVKQDAEWKCQEEHCGREHDPFSGYCLTVHHKDGDPANCSPDNLVALCQRCHLRTQGRLRLKTRRDRQRAAGQMPLPFMETE